MKITGILYDNFEMPKYGGDDISIIIINHICICYQPGVTK